VRFQRARLSIDLTRNKVKVISAKIYLVNGQGLRPVILELTTDSGHTGLGEAAIAYGIGNTAAAAMVKDLCQHFVLGSDPSQIERICSRIYDEAFWTKNGGPIVNAALSAVEQALWDIKARALGVPVYELFGGSVRDSLDTYANGWYFGCRSNSDLYAAACATVADGYTALKMYPLAVIQPNGTLRHPARRGTDEPNAMREAVDVVRGVREAVGPGVRLMLDLGGGYSIGDTIQFCRNVEQFDISYVEEPIDPSDVRGLQQLASQTTLPIAVGERLYGRAGFRDLLETRTVSILQPDIGNTGGLSEARKIAAMGEAYCLKVQPHVCGSSLATAVAMHFSASIPNFYVQEHFPYWGRVPGFIEVAKNPIEPKVRDGRMPVLDEPGYGIDLRHEALESSLWAVVQL
jgi:galactonate dehydratase